MLEGSALTAKHNIQLHLPHSLLIVLTVLFLILGGITGPSMGSWWLSVNLAVNGNEEKWVLGGLGACIDDKR